MFTRSLTGRKVAPLDAHLHAVAPAIWRSLYAMWRAAAMGAGPIAERGNPPLVRIRTSAATACEPRMSTSCSALMPWPSRRPYRSRSARGTPGGRCARARPTTSPGRPEDALDKLPMVRLKPPGARADDAWFLELMSAPDQYRPDAPPKDHRRLVTKYGEFNRCSYDLRGERIERQHFLHVVWRVNEDRREAWPGEVSDR